MRVAITGANGYIGSVLVEHCIARGIEVVACTRMLGMTGSRWPVAAVEHVQLPDGTPSAAMLSGCNAVIHVAGRAHDFSNSGDEHFEQSNFTLALNTIEAAIKAEVPRFVQVSSVSVHGNWSAEAINESSPLLASTPYARSKMAAEQALEAAARRADMELCIIRPPLVFGPECPGNFSRLVRLIQSGWPLPLASVRARRSFIYVENLADFLRVCSTRVQPAPVMKFVIGDGSDWVTPDLIRSVARELGIKSRLAPFPPEALRIAATLLGSRKEVDSITRSLLVDWSRARHDYEWMPAIPPEDAFTKTMRSYRTRQQPDST